ncbi:E3 ubiquitin-protein ligase NEURL3 isoform 1 [Schistosoma japonicum]|nr:E3 ubiquitin-protein ligase NEURL3 isoform 1 [Schistosoma japonicum]
MSAYIDISTVFSFDHRGQYVEISPDRTRARRQIGFCDGVVISQSFIRPGELVAVEITETQRGWTGDLRVGFTLLPDDLLLPLPRFALPALVSPGRSWIVPVGTAVALLLSHHHQTYWKRQQLKCSRHLNKTNINPPTLFGPVNMFCERQVDVSNMNSVSGVVSNPNVLLTNFHMDKQTVHLQSTPSLLCVCCLHTKRGRVPLSQLIPNEFELARPPDVEKGSVIAIYYELEPLPTDDSYSQCISLPVNENMNILNDINNIPPVIPDENIQNLLRYNLNPIGSEEDSDSEKLPFLFRFHIVINGIDMIAIAETVTISPSDFERDLISMDPLFSSVSDELSDNNIHVTNSPSEISGSLPTSGRHFSDFLPSSIPRMRAVFDVYGQTRAIQLRSLQQNSIAPLSRLCSCTILHHIFYLFHPNGILNNETSSFDSFSSGHKSSKIRNAQQMLVPDMMKNNRFRNLYTVLDKLPLPRVERRRLQRDAFAVLARGMTD